MSGLARVRAQELEKLVPGPCDGSAARSLSRARSPAQLVPWKRLSSLERGGSLVDARTHIEAARVSAQARAPLKTRGPRRRRGRHPGAARFRRGRAQYPRVAEGEGARGGSTEGTSHRRSNFSSPRARVRPSDHRAHESFCTVGIRRVPRSSCRKRPEPSTVSRAFVKEDSAATLGSTRDPIQAFTRPSSSLAT